MGDEKKYEGVVDPIKIFLEEALEKQRNAMTNNFEILQRVPTDSASASNIHSGGMAPFKGQVKFDIPIFEGQIY